MITIRVKSSWVSYTQLHPDKQYTGVSIILNECGDCGGAKYQIDYWSIDDKYLKICG